MSADFLKVEAPAKVNLALYVGPRRDDGYHPVCSLMEKVGLADTLMLRPRDEGLKVTGVDVPDEDNTVARAVRALEAETGRSLGLEIRLDKQIPAGAGLGGGSSDAAAALTAVTRLYDLSLPPERLAAIAAGIGADVPFFLAGGPRLAEGIGEVLSPVGCLPRHTLVLAVPEVELSTAQVYRRFDETAGAREPAFEEGCRRLRQGLGRLEGLDSLVSLLHNDLEPPAFSLAPQVAALREEMAAAGAAACLMSGSGSAVFGLFGSEEQARRAAVELKGGAAKRIWVVIPTPF